MAALWTGWPATIWRFTKTSASSMSCTPELCSASCAPTLNALSAFTSSATPASVAREVRPSQRLARGQPSVPPEAFRLSFITFGHGGGGERGMEEDRRNHPIIAKKNVTEPLYNHVKICYGTLSLRNLVSGYECGRVFPAGVGPGSPSREAAI